jgi:hypothetical protein
MHLLQQAQLIRVQAETPKELELVVPVEMAELVELVEM